jgi:hypothetical protein
LNRLVLPALLAVAVSASAAAPEQLDGNIKLVTVMSAINAAGYMADRPSPNDSPLREQIRAEVLRRNPPCLGELREFFERHKKTNDTAELSQYISLALTVKGPPDFDYTGRDVDMPPDAAPLRSFSPILARFYKEAGIEDLWKQAQPSIDRYIARLHTPITQAVQQVDLYLRHVVKASETEQFRIAVELLAPPNQVQARSYGNDFTVVVSPAPEPRTFDIRHEYLHYLLDPLATLQHETLDRKKGINDHAQRAQGLAEPFKEDFLLMTSECLIKAVEARLDHNPSAVSKALNQGFILTPYFSEQLPAYEKQELPMSGYFAEMAKAIDLYKEDARLTPVQFDKQAPVGAAVKTPAPPPPATLTGAAKTLDEAERLYAARTQDKANLGRAKEAYLSALKEASQPPLQAAAYYGLARIAALDGDPATAEQLFQKTLELSPEPQVKAWALVYLGRLSLAAGDREEASGRFQEASKVEGAPEAARKAAADGLLTVNNSKP